MSKLSFLVPLIYFLSPMLYLGRYYKSIISMLTVTTSVKFAYRNSNKFACFQKYDVNNCYDYYSAARIIEAGECIRNSSTPGAINLPSSKDMTSIAMRLLNILNAHSY